MTARRATRSRTKRGGTAAIGSPGAAGGFRKRTVTPWELAGVVASIATEALTFRKVWFTRELDPRFREKLMFAVARMNEAKYCSWAHREWALIEGASAEELARIEKMDPAEADRKTWHAILFVRALVAARFGPVPGRLMRQMNACCTAEEIEQITLVARVMDALNVSSNTFEAFLSRLTGGPARSSGIVDEAILSAAFCCALPALFTFFASSSDLSTDELGRRMVEYAARMDAEHGGEDGAVR